MERARISAAAIEVATRRLGSMLRDVVGAGRTEAGQLSTERQPLDLVQLVHDTLARLSSILDLSQARVKATRRVVAYADPSRVEHVLGNLVSNPLKYGAPGTPITVRVDEQNDEALVSVGECGPGPSLKDLPRVFERGFPTARGRKVKGLGLGLCIARLFVEVQGGPIRAESEMGEGSTFRFTLPLCQV